jgi:hypothetical protein
MHTTSMHTYNNLFIFISIIFDCKVTKKIVYVQ